MLCVDVWNENMNSVNREVLRKCDLCAVCADTGRREVLLFVTHC